MIAVERDPRCLAALAEIAAAYPGRLDVVSGDALELEAADLWRRAARVVANLPYNIAHAALIGWLRRAEAFEA